MKDTISVSTAMEEVEQAESKEPESHDFFKLKRVPDIPPSVQNPNDAYNVLVDEVINPDGLKAHNRP